MIGAPILLMLVVGAILAFGAVFIFGGNSILPGVSVAGIPVGGLRVEAAVEQLAQTWAGRGILLRDGGTLYPAAPDLLGVALDAAASAELAYAVGHGAGGLDGALEAAFGSVDISPVVVWTPDAFAAGLAQIAAQIDTAPRNAGVQIINGEVQPRPPVEGRLIDVGATVAALQRMGADAFAGGYVDLVIYAVAPEVTDATGLVEAARLRLASPFEIRAYNPVTDEATYWTALPEVWSNWLTASADSSLTLDATAVEGYLDERAGELGAQVYVDAPEAASAVTSAFAAGRNDATLRVRNRDREHTVQAGESITSIAWDYGVPYLFIQQANDGLEGGLSIGQTITIPSADDFLEFPVVFDKRVEVSISEQRVRVYENGALKWDWIASTGIASSPTWTGIYQIISHEPNAYAGNWDLWMPNFMGVYRPIPGADFTNGFHGFPTRGGSQLLWTNSLGTRVTYGCILLSDDHVRLLYDWAEEGVVVEITP